MKTRIKVFLIVVVTIAIALFAFYRLWMYPRYVVPILVYHYVDEEDRLLSV